MSSVSPSFFRLSVAFVAALAAGFVLGRMVPHSPNGGANSPAGPNAVTATAAVRDERQPPSTTSPRTGAGVEANEQWTRWSKLARNAKVERELSAALEQIAQNAPQRAMALAEAETNLRSRERLRQAALRGWAVSDPDAALAAAMKLPGVDNRAAIGAVLEGAADNPDVVIRLGRKISDGSDAVALDYGNLTIAALAENGHFEQALRFAMQGAPANRAQWLNEAFSGWARAQPAQAVAALDRVTDSALRHDALQGLIAGWAQSDPATLADYALRIPAGEDRALALGQTLTNWVLRDPAAASQWLSQRDPDPNLDGGLSSVATLPTLISQRPEVAVEWAQAISDLMQRQNTLRLIGEEWRRRSPAGLQQFLQANAALSAPDRNALTGEETAP